MARSSGLSHTTVSRIWRAFALQPHRTETFKLSADPCFIEKVRDIVGLYLDPPDRALVWCVDKKSQIQALDRTRPLLPLRPGQVERRTRMAAPALVSIFGVGPDTAATLLVAAGSNPERLHSEAAFASLCGVNPIPASSGKTNRHRLNRGGDRQANAALYRIVVVRLRYDYRTREYMRRRTGEGMSKTEVIRCLKRYVAREVFAALGTAREKVAIAA